MNLVVVSDPQLQLTAESVFRSRTDAGVVALDRTHEGFSLGGSRKHSVRLERETSITSASVFIANRPSAATAAAAAVFLPRGVFQRLLENLGFQVLFLPNADALREILSAELDTPRRHNLFAAAGSRQRTLRYKPPPSEQLVACNAMQARHQAHRHARLEGLLDHPNLPQGCPAPAPLNQGDDLNVIRRVGHRHGWGF
jgi:hypothetical protein